MIFRAWRLVVFVIGLGIFTLVSCDFQGGALGQEDANSCIDQNLVISEQIIISPSKINSRFDYVGDLSEIYVQRDDGKLIYGSVFRDEITHCRIVNEFNIQSVILREKDLFGALGFEPNARTFFVQTTEARVPLGDITAAPFGPMTFSSIALHGHSPEVMWLPFTEYTSGGRLRLSILNLSTGVVEKLYEARPEFRVKIEPNGEDCSVSGDDEITLKTDAITRGCIIVIHDSKPCSKICDENYFFKASMAEGPTTEPPVAIYLHGGPFMTLNGGVGNLGDILATVGFDVVAINYPYTLGSTNKAGGYNWHELNNWTADVISKIMQTDEFSSRKIVLIGDSFGGSLALNFSPPDDLKLDALISINPAMNTYFWESKIENLAPHYVGLFCSLFEDCLREQYFVSEPQLRALCSRAERTYIYKSEHDIVSDSNFYEEDWFSQANCKGVVFSQMDDQSHDVDLINLLKIVHRVLGDLDLLGRLR